MIAIENEGLGTSVLPSVPNRNLDLFKARLEDGDHTLGAPSAKLESLLRMTLVGSISIHPVVSSGAF